MFNIKDLYFDENNKVIHSFEASIKIIEYIREETKRYCDCSSKSEYYKFFNHTAKLLIKIDNFEKKLRENYFENNLFSELLEENNQFFHELLPQNYKTSYANPEFAVKVFGEKFGQLFSTIYISFRKNLNNAFKHKIFEMEKHNNLFIDLYNFMSNKSLNYYDILNLYRSYKLRDLERDIKFDFIEKMSKEFRLYSNIYEKDLTDLRYLFRFGKYVTENEIKTAKYLMNLPEDKLIDLSDYIADCYVRGFKVDNKDITKRSVIGIECSLGQERIVKYLIESFKSRHLDTVVAEVFTTAINNQYEYDHKFDNALLLDEEYISINKQAYEKATEKCKHFLTDFSGYMVLEKFGEDPFLPEKKSETLKLSDFQMSLETVNRTNQQELKEKYTPSTEVSFCIVAFPTPEIGNNFEDIFEDIIKINMLHNAKNEIIQKNIIDVLDTGEYVHIKGKGQNLTDINVKLQELKNPEKETNFINSGADVNIPLGEVFTTPKLKGTNGFLHIEEVFLDGFFYKNLKLKFSDGMITDYTCSNFTDEIDNKNYIQENLLFPHNTLPLSEFAIGTNTLAYVTAQKYNIMDILPILIVEKMGPHFAIGDACFAWSEDNTVYNLIDNK